MERVAKGPEEIRGVSRQKKWNLQWSLRGAQQDEMEMVRVG